MYCVRKQNKSKNYNTKNANANRKEKVSIKGNNKNFQLQNTPFRCPFFKGEDQYVNESKHY